MASAETITFDFRDGEAWHPGWINGDLLVRMGKHVGMSLPVTCSHSDVEHLRDIDAFTGNIPHHYWTTGWSMVVQGPERSAWEDWGGVIRPSVHPEGVKTVVTLDIRSKDCVVNVTLSETEKQRLVEVLLAHVIPGLDELEVNPYEMMASAGDYDEEDIDST